jgi:hypothetical protein
VLVPNRPKPLDVPAVVVVVGAPNNPTPELDDDDGANDVDEPNNEVDIGPLAVEVFVPKIDVEVVGATAAVEPNENAGVVVDELVPNIVVGSASKNICNLLIFPAIKRFCHPTLAEKKSK